MRKCFLEKSGGNKRMKNMGCKVIWVVSVLFGIYLQFGRNPDICSSYGMRSNNYYEENIAVVANKLFILDKEDCKEEIIQRCKDNNYKSIKFSFDGGMPDKWRVTVYTNRTALKLGNSSFSFEF